MVGEEGGDFCCKGFFYVWGVVEEEDFIEVFVGDYVIWLGVDLGRGREGGGEGGYYGFEGLFCWWVEDEVVEGGGGGGYGV